MAFWPITTILVDHTGNIVLRRWGCGCAGAVETAGVEERRPAVITEREETDGSPIEERTRSGSGGRETSRRPRSEGGSTIKAPVFDRVRMLITNAL